MNESSSSGDRTSKTRPGSDRWRRTFRLMLWSAPPPLMAMFARRVQRMPYAELLVVGRNSGQERRTVLTLFVVDDTWYVGHPNGRSQWVKNLTAANAAIVERGGVRTQVTPVELTDGPERDMAVNATSRQPFPAGLVYKMGRSHVRAAGSYFRLERD